jgi:cytochrome c-type biogenesis protein CcmH
MRAVAYVWLLVTLLAAGPLAAAGTATPAVFDERTMRLASELRCLVCQNQTIAESQAQLAIDLKQQIREQLAAGRSEDEVRSFMTARYGDFVLYRPPLRGVTLLLWFGPALLLAAGLLALFVVVRRRERDVGVVALSEAEHRRAQALLHGGPAGRSR